MMREWADKHCRALMRGNVRAETVALVQSCRDPQLEYADQLVHRGRRPGSAEDHQIIGCAAHRVPDDPPGILVQPAGPRGITVVFAYSVVIPRQHRVPEEVLDEIQRLARCGVAGMGDPARPERTHRQHAVVICTMADALDQRRFWRSRTGSRLAHVRTSCGICRYSVVTATAAPETSAGLLPDHGELVDTRGWPGRASRGRLGRAAHRQPEPAGRCRTL